MPSGRPPSAMTRRTLLRAGAGVAVAATTTPLWLRNGHRTALALAPVGDVVNLLANPRAAGDLTGWAAEAAGRHALQRIASDGVAPGTTAVQLDYGPVDPARGAAVIVGHDQGIAVDQHELLWARAAGRTVNGAPGTQLELLIVYLGGDGGQVAEHRVALQGGGPEHGWVELTGFDMAPPGARRAHLTVRAIGNGDPGGTLRVTNAMLAVEPGEYLPYVEGIAPLPPSVRPARKSFLRGFNDNAVAQGLLAPNHDVALHREVGSSLLRVTVDLRGSGFQSARGAPITWDHPYAAKFDALYRACRAAGVGMLPIALGVPDWMVAGRRSVLDGLGEHPTVGPPEHLHGDWARLVGALLDRWPHVAGLEVWNEPNLGQSFWQPRADPVAYTRLLRATADVVRARHPGVPVLNGGLSGLLQDGAGGADISLSAFLTAMYRAGAKGSFDGLSLHPYLIGGNSAAAMDRNLRDARSIMALNDDRRPLWITEAGSSTVGEGWGITVSEGHQAALNRMVYGRLKREADVQAVCLHTLVSPAHLGAENYENGFGVIEAGTGRRKPAFRAIAAEWRSEPPPRPRRKKGRKRKRPRRRKRRS